MGSSEENITVIYSSTGNVLIELGGKAVELSRAEAEKLFVDLGHALQDQDKMKEDKLGRY